jgi:hypothetical protein
VEFFSGVQYHDVLGLVRTHGEEAWTCILQPPMSTAPRRDYFKGSEKEGFYLYRFGETTPASSRAMAYIEWRGEQFVVMLPAPWPIIGTNNLLAPVELMVRWHPVEQRIGIGVAVVDTAFGALG